MRTLNIALAGSVAGLLTLTGRLAAQEPTATPLMEKALTDISGQRSRDDHRRVCARRSGSRSTGTMPMHSSTYWRVRS
jgi:hypothetical protein